MVAWNGAGCQSSLEVWRHKQHPAVTASAGGVGDAEPGRHQQCVTAAGSQRRQPVAERRQR